MLTCIFWHFMMRVVGPVHVFHSIIQQNVHNISYDSYTEALVFLDKTLMLCNPTVGTDVI